MFFVYKHENLSFILIIFITICIIFVKILYIIVRIIEYFRTVFSFIDISLLIFKCFKFFIDLFD